MLKPEKLISCDLAQ